MDCLEIKFTKQQSNEEIETMLFQLEKTEIVSRFSAQINRANVDRAPIKSSWGMFVNSKQLPIVAENLNHQIECFNELQVGGKPIPYHVNEHVTQGTLNDIHDLFDFNFCEIVEPRIIKSTQSGNNSILDSNIKTISKHLNRINAHVHMLESILEIDHYLKEGLVCAWFASGFTNEEQLDCYKEALKDADYDELILEENFGNIYLAYGRVGKCLYDIYESNDLALLQSGYQAKPAQCVGAGIIGLFGNYTKTQEEEMARFYQWWDDNNIDQYGYNKSDKKNALGRIKIGALVPNESIGHLFDYKTQKFDEIAVIDHYSEFSNVAGMRVVRL